jgi:uncharacterized protein YpuA (DUF1002 family)
MKFSTSSKVLLVILIASLTGCNAYQVKKRANSLESTITSYGIALRWAEHDSLYSYYLSPNGTKPPADLDRLQEISVTGLDIIEKLINPEQTEANVKTVVTYYYKTQGSIKTLKLNQKWWYNEAVGQWYIDGEFPKF